jgi:hypothetical protein
MNELLFHGWLLRYDPVATANAYAAARPVGPERCLCRDCRNFIVARQQAYPSELKLLAATLGISPLTETEIFEIGPVDPQESNLRLFGGFFHFVGEIVHDSGEPVENIYFLNQRSLLPRSFGGAPVVQVEFSFSVPWLLEERPGA